MRKAFRVISFMGGLVVGLPTIGVVVTSLTSTIKNKINKKKNQEKDPYEHY